MQWLTLLSWFLRCLFGSRTGLVAENLALRQQLALLQRTAPRPRLRWYDRAFWDWLRRPWPGWQSALIVVKPETVVRWHRAGFRLYWRWKSQRGKGRPTANAEVRWLIRRLSGENPLWGTVRIRNELRLLGHDASKATIDRYRVRHRKPPSPTWRLFLKNHVGDLVSIDFAVVPTVTFQLLYVLLLLRHERREVVTSP